MEGRSQIADLCPKTVEEDLNEKAEGEKMLRMKDLESVLRRGGMKKCSKLTEANAERNQSKEDETSQITDTTKSLHSKNPAEVMTNNSFVEPKNDVRLSLGPAGCIQSSEKIPHAKLDTERYKKNLTCLNLDLNYNPFHPYKKLGEVRSSDASECGSTTGPLEESEPLRKWKEMKQRGFLSTTHGGIPVIPKQRGRQPKRKKEEEIKKKSDIPRREQPNKHSKNAAPTGLLSGLNPGIIKHVRNSKQVNSIIEAMLQSEKSDSQMQNRPEDIIAHNSDSDQCSSYLKKHFLSRLEHGGQTIESDIAGKFYHESSTTPQFIPEHDDDSLTLKLSSAITMASENASSTSNDDLSASHDTIASLSLKGASVASQWLDLLQQDIKGRLAALRRSKKRVRNVIQTELPYLLSKEIACNQENEGCFGNSTDGGSSKKATLDMHTARWKSIFSQMDKSLHEEGKHLESWLKQVQDMQSHCDGGLKYFGANRTVLLPEEFSGMKKTEVVERENAVRAAAASIYSTCNLIMTTGNKIQMYERTHPESDGPSSWGVGRGISFPPGIRLYWC